MFSHLCELENVMFGGQQIRAYKTIMKTSRLLPRRTQSDVLLFRVIVWGAVIVLTLAITAMIAAKIANLDLSSEGLMVMIVPTALTLLFCWWWTDTAPLASTHRSVRGKCSLHSPRVLRAFVGATPTSRNGCLFGCGISDGVATTSGKFRRQ